MTRPSLRSTLDVTSSVAMLVVSSMLFWAVLTRPSLGSSSQRQGPSPKLPDAPVRVEHLASLGSGDAAMIINSDFECPFCRRFALETFPRVVKEFVASGKLTVYFQHVPIESVHKNAVGAAIAAECAGKQGQFWAMHDAIFSRPDGVQPALLLDHARRLKLTEADFRNCTDGDGQAIIAEHISNSSRLGIRSTPNFFLGRLIAGKSVEVSSVLTGAQPWATFEREIGVLIR